MLRSLRKTSPGSRGSLAALPVAVLSVSADDADHSAVRAALASVPCSVTTAGTCAGTARSLREARVSVLICENTLPDGTWRDVLENLRGKVDAPVVIVTSRHADDKLWAEVLNVGGFDVLAKPLDPEELLHVVLTASLRLAMVYPA